MTIDNSIQEIQTPIREVFTAKVQTYLTFKTANYINTYWYPILVPIGLIGNTLSFLVMIKPNNRKMSTCIYMAAISINDNVMMILAVYFWLISVQKVYQVNHFVCGLEVYLSSVTMQNSTYQVIAMALDKCIAIKWPHKAAIYSTTTRAKMTALAILLCTFIFNIPHGFISFSGGYHCIAYFIGGTYANIYSWISFIFNGLVPFISLMYMNCIIINMVRGS